MSLGRGVSLFFFCYVPPHHVQKERRNRERQRHLLSHPEDRNDYDNNNNAETDQNRRRAQGENAQQVGALYQGYGTHYADLWCGTPPQRQTVIVDTGSSVTAFPSSGCTGCGVPDYHIDKLFSEADSDTFEKLTCDECLKGHCSSSGSTGDECKISMSYQEGSSWSAYSLDLTDEMKKLSIENEAMMSASFFIVSQL
jgi:hypothetical protein